MIFVVDKRALIQATPDQLRAKVRRLNDHWVELGRPAEDRLPVWMHVARAALRAELDRRGSQLSLF